MIQGLVVDEANHAYSWEGRRLPSVTQVLRVLDDFGDVPKDVLDFAAFRGTAVHEATALADRDDLDEESLDPELAGYVAAWRRFREESGFEPLLVEHRVVNLQLGYAGTVDRVGQLGGRMALLDIKSGSRVPRSAGPQLAGYWEALTWMVEHGYLERSLRLHYRDRYVVHLRPEGRYSLVPMRDPRDRSIFAAALDIWNWKEAL